MKFRSKKKGGRRITYPLRESKGEYGHVKPGRRVVSLKEAHPIMRLQRRQATISTKQAARMIANREVPVTGSLTLQNEYDSVNKQHFDGKLPEATIMLVNMPQVKHKAFAIPKAKIIVVNTAHTKSTEEQKADLRHEMIHLSGIDGHGYLFEIRAKQINAPMADYEGRSISAQELEDLQFKRKMEREQLEQKRLEEKYGVKKGEGQLMQDGKPVARVLFYETRAGVSTKNVRDVSDIPESSKSVAITTFDQLGYPKGKSQIITRQELGNFTLSG